MKLDRFVVGTGRCGSTLLTRMLSCHDELLGLNEVFTGLDWGRRFTTTPVSGVEVAEILGEPNSVVQMVTARGHEAEEVTYPFGPGSRYGRGDPVPWILTSTLGHLSDDPDEHWDRLAAWLSEQQAAPIAEHYRALFDHLAVEAGKSLWVERSGSSIEYSGGLLDCFSAGEARVIHIHRDGAEVALSMRNHAFYRLAVQLYYGIVPRGVDPEDEAAVVDGWLDGDPPVELYGRYWSEQICRGVPALAAAPDTVVMTVAFEDLVADPAAALEAMAEFLELPADSAFAGRGAALVNGIPATRASSLPEDDRKRLEQACAPGRATLSG
ncbi:MAG: sulfotransferase domain-containing protein [Microthrixaceae bacterium]